MSYFDDASLVMIPSGYKTSKVYSVKPTDGSGDLTFTRSNDTATRVGPDGLIEKVRTNQVRNSTMVGASAPSTLPTNWVLSSAGLTFTVIGTGTEDGLTYIEVNATGTASSSNARIGFDSATQIFGATGQYWTNSFYFKKVSETAAPDNYAMAIFENTSAGSLVVANVGSLPATTSLARYSYTVLTSGGATVARVQPFVRFSLTSGNSYNFTFRIAATQMEQGDIATDYIATTTAAVSVGPVANVPRLDYLNSSCPRLLLEPQRTNLVTYSEQIDNAAWGKTNATVTANATTSPSGYTDADKVVSTTTNGVHQFRVTVSGVTAQSYTMSIFAKKGEYNFIRLWEDGQTGFQSFYNLDTGVATNVNMTSVGIQDYGNGWYRCTATVAIPASGVFGFRVLVTPDGTANSYAGNGTNGVFVWGAQLEAGAYATSYIPTLGSASTRGSDAASKTGISSLIGQTEGVVFIDINRSYITSSYDRFFAVDDADAGIYRTGIFILPEPSIDGRVYIELRNNSTGVFGYTYNSTTIPRLKIAVAYKNNDMAIYVNGTQMATSSASLTFAHTLSRLLSSGNGQSINETILFPTRLSNADLAALTTI